MRRWIVYIIYVIVIVALILAIIFAFAKKDDNKAKTKNAPTSQMSKAPQSEPSNSNTKTQSTTDKKKTSSSAATNNAKQTAAANAAATQQLVNTGPGATASIVGATVILGYAAHSFRVRKQLN